MSSYRLIAAGALFLCGVGLVSANDWREPRYKYLPPAESSSLGDLGEAIAPEQRGPALFRPMGVYLPPSPAPL